MSLIEQNRSLQRYDACARTTLKGLQPLRILTSHRLRPYDGAATFLKLGEGSATEPHFARGTDRGVGFQVKASTLRLGVPATREYAWKRSTE